MIRKYDYKEMEVLVNGNWEKHDVLKELVDETCLYLMGQKASNGDYMSGAVVPGESYREIVRTKKIVKSAVEIMKILVDNGYEVDDDGDWNRGVHHVSFNGAMFQFCGKEPSSHWTWEEEWLEEVLVEASNKVEIMDDEDEDSPLFI